MARFPVGSGPRQPAICTSLTQRKDVTLLPDSSGMIDAGLAMPRKERKKKTNQGLYSGNSWHTCSLLVLSHVMGAVIQSYGPH